MANRPVLAIDTSTDWAGVALATPIGIRERNWQVGRDGTVQVPEVIAGLLREAEIRAADLAGCVVAIGPGSFSGLRVGLSLAKGFTLAVGMPLLGIPTFQVTLARTALDQNGVGVIRAGRSRLVWASNTAPDHLQSGTLSDLITWLVNNPVDMLVGEVSDEQADQIRQRIAITIADDRLRRASDLLKLGMARFEAGDISDPATLAPLYLHPR